MSVFLKRAPRKRARLQPKTLASIEVETDATLTKTGNSKAVAEKSEAVAEKALSKGPKPPKVKSPMLP